MYKQFLITSYGIMIAFLFSTRPVLSHLRLTHSPTWKATKVWCQFGPVQSNVLSEPFRTCLTKQEFHRGTTCGRQVRVWSWNEPAAGEASHTRSKNSVNSAGRQAHPKTWANFYYTKTDSFMQLPTTNVLPAGNRPPTCRLGKCTVGGVSLFLFSESPAHSTSPTPSKEYIRGRVWRAIESAVSSECLNGMQVTIKNVETTK